jgi:hypothetical protein
VRTKYQRKERKSNHKFEVVRGQELLVRVPLPTAEVWAEMQTQVEELTGQAGLQILRAVLQNEVTRRVEPPHRPNPSAGCVRWGKQPGYVVFSGRKVPVGLSTRNYRRAVESVLGHHTFPHGSLQLPVLLQLMITFQFHFLAFARSHPRSFPDDAVARPIARGVEL